VGLCIMLYPKDLQEAIITLRKLEQLLGELKYKCQKELMENADSDTEDRTGNNQGREP